jgi:hypothetical protein
MAGGGKNRICNSHHQNARRLAMVIEFGIANATSSELTAKSLSTHYRFGTVLRLNTASKRDKTRSRTKDCETQFRSLNSAQNRTFVELATDWDSFSQAGRRGFESLRPL